MSYSWLFPLHLNTYVRVYDRNKYFTLSSRGSTKTSESDVCGIDFRRQNLTSADVILTSKVGPRDDVRFWRLKPVPALKGLNKIEEHKTEHRTSFEIYSIYILNSEYFKKDNIPIIFE